MKRNAAAALAALCLLTGCAQEAAPLSAAPQTAAVVYQEPVAVEKTAMAQEAAFEMMRQFALEQKVTFSFTPENFPRTAVSAAAAPLLRAAAASLLDGSGGNGGSAGNGGEADSAGYGGEAHNGETAPLPEPQSFPASADACRALLDGSAALILAEEPPAAVWDEKDAAGFNWEMTPVVADALVFAVSADNPVDALTVQQIRGLYDGTITNWSELGGADLPVVPLRGGPGSDTETAMENLVLDGTSMPRDPALERESMEALLDGAAQPGAIACAGFYRARALSGAACGWKLIRVDGAAPSEQTVRSGAYPLLNRCYVLIPAAAPQDSPERALRDWLVSRDGQELASRAGYVPMMELGGVT